MSLGSRIREYRLKRGFTQSQMAEKLNMTEANFSSYERDKSTPPTEKLNQIASILGVSTDYLLGRTNDPYVQPTSADFEDIDEEARSLARDIQKLDSGNRVLLKNLIKSLSNRGDEARDDK
jgi:transcriptional regulator with XRE-family HTH domain